MKSTIGDLEDDTVEMQRRHSEVLYAVATRKAEDRKTLDRILTETGNPEIRQFAEIARRYL